MYVTLFVHEFACPYFFDVFRGKDILKSDVAQICLNVKNMEVSDNVFDETE